jgi:hypothetical protein
MARKKETEQEKTDDSLIVSAAKAIGSTAGKIASLAGGAAPAPKIKKLASKGKSRLPRRQKKAQKKLAAAQK